jgi:hypothetical protein
VTCKSLATPSVAYHVAPNYGEVFAESGGLLQFLSAEGFGGRKEVDGFEPVGLSLTVIALDDVQSGTPTDSATQISEMMYFKRFEQHMLNNNICCSARKGRGFQAGKYILPLQAHGHHHISVIVAVVGRGTNLSL